MMNKTVVTYMAIGALAVVVVAVSALGALFFRYRGEVGGSTGGTETAAVVERDAQAIAPALPGVSDALPTTAGIPSPAQPAGDPEETLLPVSAPPAGAALDSSLQAVILQHGLQPIDLGPEQEAGKVALGEALFFDKEISGNRDISCATCHHPLLHGGDGLPLPFGTGAKGLGTARKIGVGRELVPRNAPEIFNRGAPQWTTMFWDGRVVEEFDYFGSPAGDKLPAGLDNSLAVQAMFPVTSRAEMRGTAGDLCRPYDKEPAVAHVLDGEPLVVVSEDEGMELNEVALVEDDDLDAIWEALMDRLLAIPEYRDLFAAAYPQTTLGEFGFQHAANAIAAYEIDAFSFDDSPWDRYLAGDKSALSDEAKAGALLFYGDAGCGSCHSGVLLTDQRYHNIAAPQLGPGKDASGLDYGRYLETGEPQDKFAFRTPPLRNVAITGPWLHNGAYTRLADVLEHHLNPTESLGRYAADHLPSAVRESLRNEPDVITQVLSTLDPLIQGRRALSDEELARIMAFLHAQTSPSAVDLSYLVPETVPSGLPVWD